jgi:CheY-like chemotaxis protein
MQVENTGTPQSWAEVSILLVDDEAFALQFASKVLTGLGVGTILTADSGQEALGILASRSEAVSLIITDIEMPEMDGYQFTRRLRLGAVPQYKDIPIIMLTGHYNEDYTKKAQAHRIQSFIVKPPSLDVLKMEIGKVLGF